MKKFYTKNLFNKFTATLIALCCFMACVAIVPQRTVKAKAELNYTDLYYFTDVDYNDDYKETGGIFYDSDLTYHYFEWTGAALDYSHYNNYYIPYGNYLNLPINQLVATTPSSVSKFERMMYLSCLPISVVFNADENFPNIRAAEIEDSLVVIDIRQLIGFNCIDDYPLTLFDVLELFCSILHENGNKIMFICQTEELSFSNTNFLNYVDIHITADFFLHKFNSILALMDDAGCFDITTNHQNDDILTLILDQSLSTDWFFKYALMYNIRAHADMPTTNYPRAYQVLDYLGINVLYYDQQLQYMYNKRDVQGAQVQLPQYNYDIDIFINSYGSDYIYMGTTWNDDVDSPFYCEQLLRDLEIGTCNVLESFVIQHNSILFNTNFSYWGLSNISTIGMDKAQFDADIAPICYDFIHDNSLFGYGNYPGACDITYSPILYSPDVEWWNNDYVIEDNILVDASYLPRVLDAYSWNAFISG